MHILAALLHLLTTPRPRWHGLPLVEVDDADQLVAAHAARISHHPAGAVLVTAQHRPGHGRRVPGYLLALRGRAPRREGRLALALRYVGLIGGLVGCAVILGAPPVLAVAAGIVGAVLGTALGLAGGAR